MVTDQGNNIVFGDTTCKARRGQTPTSVALADNGGPTQTMALPPGSAAIDFVPANACPVTTDQRGVARPQGAACDAGAYELAPPSIGSPGGQGRRDHVGERHRDHQSQLQEHQRDGAVWHDHGLRLDHVARRTSARATRRSR